MTQDAPRAGSGSPPEPEDRVPVFGTWPRIYAAVLICLALVMAGIALFQNGSF